MNGLYRSSYDTLAHGSARVIPVGMAAGQAAGAAAKLAIDHNLTFRKLTESKPLIAELQKRLNEQGMELEPYELEAQPYMKHVTYPGVKAAVYMGIAHGSYQNAAFEPDRASNTQRIVNQMNSVRRMYKDQFKGDPSHALKGVAEPAKTALSLPQACLTIALAAGLTATLDDAQAVLEQNSLLSRATLDTILDPAKLTDGNVFMMLKDAVGKLTGEEDWK